MSLPITMEKTRASENGQVQDGGRGNIAAEEPLQTVSPVPYHQDTFIEIISYVILKLPRGKQLDLLDVPG